GGSLDIDYCLFGGTELHSWAGCPSDFLSTLHGLITFAHCSGHPPPEEINERFDRLQRFDTMSWAARSPQPASAQVRYSLGQAWKGAIEIYGRRVLAEQYPDVQAVSGDLIEATLFHLRQIDHRDTHFKGIVWPVFVVGAEAQTAEQREAILAIFGHLIDLFHISLLDIAIAQLKRIWVHPTPYPPGSSWIHEIWERNEGLLLL
ncbi:hypothetical protein F5Y13DRAFT_197382, partial [Hypoxylon sp. FL1857]